MHSPATLVRPAPLLKFPVRLIVINFLVAMPSCRCYPKAGSYPDNQNFRSKIYIRSYESQLFMREDFEDFSGTLLYIP